MTKVVIYTTDVCPKCKILKKYLNEKNVPFEEMNMGTPDALTELAMNNIFTNVAPVLQVGNKFLTYKDIFTGSDVNDKQIQSLL
ncbi:glutaredoxin family protein [Methanolapillus millepedarum]|uniref:Glutaredoxin domain-containing protein n=1 Tax=Methanolapillus millepedarum TaxID=3028296 RepID=A0AA96ZW32_9EURY|nr:hypothetical protein MsAc7_10440 [Methanosarcinaceae archaeon Ac7]